MRVCEFVWGVSISIHALLAESDLKLAQTSLIEYISIHALLAESDDIHTLAGLGAHAFLSTLSLRRATVRKCQVIPIIQISIHALLAESDRLGLPGWLRVLISIHALLAESDR